ncbi:MAG: sensor histidine kinase [Leptolyngbyaceae cyanobacterium]
MAYYQALEMASFKGGFLMRTAHELRSPLNQIISLQQMILEGLCDDIEEEHQFVADAHAASLKMLAYLDLMIRVSKIEMGRLAPQIQTVSLAAIFDRVKALTEVQMADRNLRLVVESPSTDHHAAADPTWLRNLLVMLIEGAIAGGDRGTIRLRSAPVENSSYCQLWLEDDRSTTLWQEPIELPAPAEFTLDDRLSASLRMALVHAMLTAMTGQLSIISGTEPGGTRLQITLPTTTSE